MPTLKWANRFRSLEMLEQIEVKTVQEINCRDCGEHIDYTMDGDNLCEDCAWKRNGPWQSVFTSDNKTEILRG